MHPDAVPITIDLARTLLKAQFPEWAGESLTLIEPEGTDNVMFRLGSDKVLRLPRRPRVVPTLEKECTWLPKLAPHVDVPVPDVLGRGEPTQDYPFPWAIMNQLPGHPPASGELDLNQAADDIAAFIMSLHKIDTAGAPVSTRNGNLRGQDLRVHLGFKQLPEQYDVDQLNELWAESIAAPEWDQPLVWTHGDIHPGNLLAKDKRITAVIDFGLTGIGDPAVDLMAAWAILDTESRSHFRSKLNFDDDAWLRARGWILRGAALAYPYYKDTNKTLADISLNSLDEVLKDQK